MRSSIGAATMQLHNTSVFRWPRRFDCGIGHHYSAPSPCRTARYRYRCEFVQNSEKFIAPKIRSASSGLLTRTRDGGAASAAARAQRRIGSKARLAARGSQPRISRGGASGGCQTASYSTVCLRLLRRIDDLPHVVLGTNANGCGSRCGTLEPSDPLTSLGRDTNLSTSSCGSTGRRDAAASAFLSIKRLNSSQLSA